MLLFQPYQSKIYAASIVKKTTKINNLNILCNVALSHLIIHKLISGRLLHNIMGTTDSGEVSAAGGLVCVSRQVARHHTQQT